MCFLNKNTDIRALAGLGLDGHFNAFALQVFDSFHYLQKKKKQSQDDLLESVSLCAYYL